jgi:carbon-monoxide dehydrogenase medium subunit
VKLSSLGVNDWPAASAAALFLRDERKVLLQLGLCALADTPVFRSVDVTDLDGPNVAAAAVLAADEAMAPIADIRGKSDYKRRLGRVAVRDAVAGALEESTHA